MPLSEDEKRILSEIEQQFHASDPEFAGELGRHSVYAHCLRQMRWAGLAFFAGVVVLVFGLGAATNFGVAFVGFVVMLASALWFERSLRKMGRAGKQQLSQSFKAGNLREYFGSAGTRARECFRRDDE